MAAAPSPSGRRRKLRPEPEPEPEPWVLLDSLPYAKMYEKSYTHPDVVTQVAVSVATKFFITGSADGHLTFWKKKPLGIDFAKQLRSHHGPIEGLAVSMDGILCCTIGNDLSLNIYDVVNCDMMSTFCLPFIPGCVEWVYKEGKVKSELAISDRNSSFVHIYDARSGEAIISREIPCGPVKVMKFNHIFDTVISGHEKGFIKYWNPYTLQFPDCEILSARCFPNMDRNIVVYRPLVAFEPQQETDLSAIVNCKTSVSTIEISPDGKLFSVTSPDCIIRVFWFKSGKLCFTIDESLENAQSYQNILSHHPCKLEDSDFSRRMAVEEQFWKTETAPQPNAVFDKSSKFLIYAAIHGIKVFDVDFQLLTRVIGNVDSNHRFLKIALYQGDLNPSAATKANESKEPLEPSQMDPTLLCCAFRKHAIYLFSQREPCEDQTQMKRDVPLSEIQKSVMSQMT